MMEVMKQPAFALPFPRLRGKVPKADGGAPQARESAPIRRFAPTSPAGGERESPQAAGAR